MRERREDKKIFRFEGSFTVEASMLMILVLTGIFISIFLGFYLHDRTVLEGEARKLALRTSRCIAENGHIDTGEIDWNLFQSKDLLWRVLGGPDKSAELEEALEKETEGELLICDMPSFAVICSGADVRIKFQAQIQFPMLGFLTDWWKLGDIQGEVLEKNMESEELIRLIRGIKPDK